jgi:metallo-beta-lactamase family protein
VRLTFLGAAREVTGSMFLLEVGRGSLLIDCGLVQGRRDESRRRNRVPPPGAVAADAVVLTHAHVDHSGNLPTLVKAGFGGPIYATPATRDLCEYMLRDAARIQEGDAAYLNRKYAREPGYEPVEPLYHEDDAARALARFEAVAYHRAFEPLPGVTARLLDAGHILGSASVVLDVAAGGATRRLAFSGDLGRKGLPILRDPEAPPGPVDYAVLESTYGNRVHPPVERAYGELERVVKEAVARGGKVIVPAFAVGRTQELLYALDELRRQGRLPPVPVFIDSPLAINATEVFRRHPECFDVEARARLAAGGDLFGFAGVRFAGTRDESMAINALEGPAIVISAAGMAEAGRVLHHLRNHVEDERSTILIVGFMARHTLGRRLAERRSRVRIWGVERDLRARVEVLDALSAHADRDGLLAYAEACGGAAARRFFLVHGEPDQQGPLRDAMAARGMRVHVPARGEAVVLD